jgi:hypothetical protein
VTECVAGAARPHGGHQSRCPDAPPLEDRRGDQDPGADRWLTVDLAEVHTPDRALPQWAIDSLLFGMPKHSSSAKI